MRRRLIATAAGLAMVLAALLLWWFSGESEAEVPEATVVRRVKPPKRPAWVRRPFERGAPRLPELLQQPPEHFEDEPIVDEPDVEDVLATLSGFVMDEQGRPLPGSRIIFRCVLLDEGGEPGFVGAMSDIDGYFSIDVTAPTWCRGRAMRRSGLLMATSMSEEVDLDPGDDVELEFALPSRAGGLGVRFDAHGDEMVVMQVYEGTPAWQAGLRHGDRIVAIEGEPVVPGDTNDFLSRMIGPAGTEVRFTLRYEGEQGTVEEQRTITRAYLDSDLIQ